MSTKNILIGIGCLLLLGSCVSSKKYKQTVEEVNQLNAKNSELTAKNTELTNQVSSLQTKVNELNNSTAAMKQDYDKFKAQCAANEEKLKVVQAYFEEQYNTLMEVEKKIETALEDFDDKGVDVYYKDGLVYVSMEDNLMYKSGSSALTPKGKEALSSLGTVLNDYPKLKVIVLGHTDDVKSKGGRDNWSLSTERANGVVRVLRDNYKVDPSRLTAAGKGKYNPVADNSTAEGRAKNRRTEIILNPDLVRLWQEAKKDN